MILLDTNIFITLLATAEEYAVEAIVTWNKKHFVDRTTLRVLTPAEYVVV